MVGTDFRQFEDRVPGGAVLGGVANLADRSAYRNNFGRPLA